MSLGTWPPPEHSWRRLQSIPHALSLGVGVQSSTLLMMAAQGLISPKPKAAIFADTKNEPQSVYNWLDFLLTIKWPFDLYVVSKGNLAQDNLRVRRSKHSGLRYLRSIVPVYMKNPDGSRGVMPRGCTAEYKIKMIERTIKQRLIKRRVSKQAGTLPRSVSWIGISTDEADRMKPSRYPWVVNRWPLVELGMSREDCKNWVKQSEYYPLMLKAGFTEPPRSACRQCPYRSDVEWLWMKEQDPQDFVEAVIWESEYQRLSRDESDLLDGVPFLHKSLVTLDKVIFNPNQGRQLMSNECEGICGV